MNRFQDWARAVCEQVRFQPDRKAIEKELQSHYEDHYQDLLRLNYAPDLAAERALNAMGNAQEVGRALDRVHKPWLGWLWEASRFLALGLAALALATLFHIHTISPLAERTRQELSWEAPPALAERLELEHATLWAAPGEVFQRDGHTVAEVRLWLQMRDPFGGPQAGRTWLFSWRDGLGELPLKKYDPITRSWPETRFWQYGSEKCAAWTRFQETVELILDAPPQWAEASLAGQDWTLRIEWEAEP